MSSIWLRIAGTPGTEIAAHTPPSWETSADGGCTTASFAFALSARAVHQSLRAKSLVQIMSGPAPIWTGLLSEPDRTTGECNAYGLSSALRTRLAFDSGGNLTRELAYAITQAIARGWPGSNPKGVTGTVAGDPDANPITVGALLDQYAEQTGMRWGVNGAGELYMSADPTIPKWLASPGAAAFGVTDEDTPTRLAGRYLAGPGTYAMALVGTGDTEEAIDLTEWRTLTAAQAEGILGGMLLRAGDTKWTNGVTLHREQLTTMGGQRSFLPGVVGGQLMRAHGLSQGVTSQSPWLDVTIGKTRYTAGEDVIYVEPVNTAPRTLRAVVAAA